MFLPCCYGVLLGVDVRVVVGKRRFMPRLYAVSCTGGTSAAVALVVYVLVCVCIYHRVYLLVHVLGKVVSPDPFCMGDVLYAHLHISGMILPGYGLRLSPNTLKNPCHLFWLPTPPPWPTNATDR